ncbi:MAG: hypothetical protein SGI89_13465 [bacterium]|nr:hypothetical protein [bacterium]
MLSNKVYVSVMLILTGFTLSAYGQSDTSMFGKIQIKDVTTYEALPDDIRNSLGMSFDTYLRIMEDLGNNDSISSRDNALKVFDQMSTLMKNNVIEDNWRMSDDRMSIYRTLIGNATSLNQQRLLFNELTGIMTKVIDKYGIPGRTIYMLQSDGSLSGGKGKWLTEGINGSDPYSGINGTTYPVTVIQGWNFRNSK